MLNKILRAQPWLVLYNYNNITDRLQKATDGDVFIAFNKKKEVFEVHSIKSFELDPNCHSKNGEIEKEYINDWIIKTIFIQDNKRFLAEKIHERDSHNELLDQHEERMKEHTMNAGLSNLDYILGRSL